MITGDANDIQIMGAADDVEIMGFADATSPAPGVTCPAGADYCYGKSQLSPTDLARVQQENAALQINSAKKNTAFEVAAAIGVVLLLAGGVAYATHKG